MKVILDTNIFLNFYRLDGKQSVEMIDRLVEFINSEKIELIIPWQIEMEFLRNKNSNEIFEDHVSNFEQQLTVNLQIPQILKASLLAAQLRVNIKKLSEVRKKIVKLYKNRILNPKSKINQKINKIFGLAKPIQEDNAVLQRAHYRTLRGSPPRKRNSSFGDAIIWEAILEHCGSDDVIIVSGDGDFESQLSANKGDIHEVLRHEWDQKNKTSIKLYTTLGKFINDQLPKERKPIPSESIKEEEEINRIALTSSAILSPFNSFGSQLYGLGDITSSASVVNSGFLGFCSCCGVLLGGTDSIGGNILGGPRCEKCFNMLSIGVSCEKCAKHFHIKNFDFINTSEKQNKYCKECYQL